MKRSLMWVLAAIGALSTGGCSDAVDVSVANPCDKSVEVRMWLYEGFTSPERLNEIEPEAEGRVPAEGVAEVGALISEPGDYEYILLAGTTVVRFDQEALDKNDGVVVLPASSCG